MSTLRPLRRMSPGGRTGKNAFRNSFFLAALLLPVAVAQGAWLAWFLSEPLPNAPTDSGPVRRWIFLAQIVPELVPGVRFEQSQLGLALRELSHLENLPQRLPVVLAAGLISAAAVALGRLVLRGIGVTRLFDRWETLALAFGLGTTGLGLITLGIGRLGLLGAWPIRIGLTLSILTEWLLSIRDHRRRDEIQED